MRKRVLAAIAALAVILGGAGCTTLSGAGSPTESVATRMTVQFAALKYIERAPLDARAARAARVYAVAVKARDLVSGDVMTTVGAIEETVRAAIDWSRFDAADRLLVDNLIALVRAELEARVGAGGLHGDELLAVRNVIDWVASAAKLGGAV